MRVLHTVASLRSETGGPARSVPGLANALVDLGVEVHVWSPDVPENLTESARFVIHRGTLEEALDNISLLGLVHDHGLWLPVNHRVAIETGKRKIPRVVSPRGMLEPWAINHKKWKKRLAWWLYQRQDLYNAIALHATAESEAEQFLKLGLKQTIVIIPNGVEIPAPTSDLRLQTSGPKIALFLSRIHPKKGLPLLVEAWDRVRPEGWRMIVVGPDEGGHRSEVEAMVRAKGLGALWEFREACEGKAKEWLLANADLFILPSYSENFGNVVAEALAVGVPVITTTGTPWNGLLENRCGYWADPSVDGLANSLRRATLLSVEERHEMGERGKLWVARDFSWEGIGTKMLATYEKLMDSESK